MRNMQPSVVAALVGYVCMAAILFLVVVAATTA